MKPPVHAVRDLGQTIKRLRLQRKMTQQELADASGLDIRYIGASREDSGIPRLEVLPDLLQVSFAVSVRFVSFALPYIPQDRFLSRVFSNGAFLQGSEFCLQERLIAARSPHPGCRNEPFPEEARVQLAGMAHSCKKR